MIPLWAIGGAAGGCLLLGVAGGWTVRDWKADADQHKAAEKAEKQRDVAQAELFRQAKAFEEWRQQQDVARVESRNTIREVFRNVPVSADCAAPTAVFSLLDGKVAAANAAAAGQFTVSVPAAGAPAEPADRPR